MKVSIKNPLAPYDPNGTKKTPTIAKEVINWILE
jgi:hypothetical protein